MSVSLNWQAIVQGVGVLLIFGGVVWFAVIAWRNRSKPSLTVDTRKADDPPPAGAIAWVLDIVEAMGSAKAESILACLKSGANRDAARQARIAELESLKTTTPKQEPKK